MDLYEKNHNKNHIYTYIYVHMHISPDLHMLTGPVIQDSHSQ